MSDTEVDYLQPDFDPASVTMPRLRSILVSHNVPYPATAKKAQLVAIFNDNVAPQAKKILDRRAKAKRSSMGITNIDNSTGYSVVGEQRMPPPSASRRTRSPRKAATRANQESEEPEPIPQHIALSPRKRQSRSAGRQLAQSDTDTDSHYEASRSPRKASRRPDLTPQAEVKQEQFQDDVMFGRQSADPDNVFTTDNPFQSGSSPMSMQSPSDRRRTTAGDSTTKRTTSSTTRRRTDGHKADGHKADGPDHSVFSKKFEVPMNDFSRPKTPEPPVVEAGEEFTPDEQLALAQEDADRGQTALVPRRPTKRSTSLATPVWVLIVTLFSAYAAWYRQEKLAVGYCGVGRETQEIIPRQLSYKDFTFELPEWAIQLAEPECEPCPSHAFCYKDYSVRCENDYILKPHPLSAGGLVPLPPTCEPDGEKVRRVKAVADKAVEQLRERKAKFECGELVDEKGQQSESPAIAVEELKETVSEQRSKKLSRQEFDDLWASALGEIEARDEVNVEKDPEPETNSSGSGGVSTYLSSTSLARLPLGCAVRRSVRLGLERHRLGLISVVMSLLTVLYGRSRYRSYRATSAQIPALVDLVLGRLAAQKELAYEEGVGEDDPFLFLPNLRDDILRSVHSLSERERIWHRVRAVVEQNTNVRTGQREGRNGEVGRAWEWIGPSGAIENSARRRRSGRVSWGFGTKEPEDAAVDKSGIHNKWEEPGSRPTY